MFRDTQEELERLQAQLLAQTEQQEQTDQQETQFLDEEEFEELLSDTDQGQSPAVYQNYSNDYGRDLRNYATGYKAYNADKTDKDPQQMSRELLEEPRAVAVWPWLILILMAAVVGAMVWMCISGGLF